MITGCLQQGTKWNRCFDIWLLFPVSVGSFHNVTQGRRNCYLKMTSKQEFLSSLLLSANNAVKSVPSMNESQKHSVFFSYPSISNSLYSKTWEHHGCTEALISRVTASTFPCVSSLVNPFLGHIGTAHEEIGCGSLSESAVCHLGLLPNELIFHWKWSGSKEFQTACFLQKSQRFDLKYSCHKYKESNWMDFQALARPHCFRANGEKNANFSNNIQDPDSHSVCSLQYPRIFHTDLGSLDPSDRENLMEQTFWCFLFSVSVGAYLQ